MTTEKLVTHADLEALRALNNSPVLRGLDERVAGAVVGFLRRLIAAAEADAPPLPEGWVVYTAHDGGKAVFWHRGGAVYQWDNDSDVYDYVNNEPDRLTPLRATVSAEQCDRVADELWDQMVGVAKSAVRASTADAFAAAGVEVTR